VKVSVLVATFGHTKWKHLARTRAIPSADVERPHEVLSRHDAGGTLASVRNRLAEEATGDFLCHLDADDQLAPGYLDAMAHAWYAYIGPQLTRHPPLAGPPLLVPAVQYLRDDEPFGQPAIPARGEDPNAARRMIEINCCVVGTLVPRNLFLKIGGFREALADGTPLSSLEDWDVFLRCQIAGARLVPVPAAVYRATMSANGRNADQSPYRAIRAELELAWREAVLGR
jgi:hypothetical protein